MKRGIRRGIKRGAQLIVRESQSAVFFYTGKAYDAFPACRHLLKPGNIPVLTKILLGLLSGHKSTCLS